MSAWGASDGFQIYLSRDWFEVVIEAPATRGEIAAKNYIATFERVISLLGSMDAVLLGAMLNTRHTATQSLASRLIDHPRLKYPVLLSVAVPSDLRLTLTKVAMRLHSSARDAGSTRRRVSLFVRVPKIPRTDEGVALLRERLMSTRRKERLGF